MKYENLKDIPIRIYNYSVMKPQYYCNKEIKLIFVLKGEVTIINKGNIHTLAERDMFLINSSSIYCIEGLSGNEICVLEIDTDCFDCSYEGFSRMRFDLSFSGPAENQSEEAKHLWSMLYETIQALYKKERGYVLKVKNILFEFVLMLANKYVDKKFKNKENANIEEKRLQSIMDYINVHYKEKITLGKIAEDVNLNPQYLSRYFSKYMSMTLSEYIFKVRLRESLKDLCDKRNTITYVALENGFPNLKSYFKTFKEQYNTTPSLYRNNNIGMSAEMDSTHDNSDINEEREKHVIDCSKSSDNICRSWSKIAAFGRASEGLRAEWRNQLRTIQKEIPFEYIRFHGIFSDDMMIYSEDSFGNAEYNFSYVDELIDFLLKVKIKPFIELSYMPEQLASEKKYVFNWKANASHPKSLDKWKGLVENFIRHLVERYGINEVSSWYFEIWNTFIRDYGFDNVDMDFFKETFLTIKKVNNKIRVGGINTTLETLIDTHTVGEYDSLCSKENIQLDFVSLKAYSIVPADKNETMNSILKKINIDSKDKLILQNSIDYCIYADENYISDNIQKILETVNKCTSIKKQLFITEWNTSPDPRDPLHDTCFKSPFLVKNIIDNFQKVHGMGYWTFTDIFEEVKTSSETFHGGLGFITNNGLKKPTYYAYKLLNRLGNTLVKKGDNFIVTKNEDGSFQILVHNYCHFRSDAMKCGSNDITIRNRDDIFNNKIKKVSFVLKEIKGEIIKKTYKINKANGSVFDELHRMGAPEVLTPEDVNYLKDKSIFGYKKEQSSAGCDLVIHEKMEPQEVMLIEIVPKE